MPRHLSRSSSLDALRSEAKRRLKAITAGDPEALARFREAFPDPTATPKLRQVQHALAREYGFASWAMLKGEIEDRKRTSTERVRLFLEKSVNRYSTDPSTQKWGVYERDGPTRGELAARLLERHPEIVRDSIHTAVGAHDLDAVRTFLRKNAGAVRDRCDLDGWTPLVRLAYTRIPIEAARANALAVATLLIARGADPFAPQALYNTSLGPDSTFWLELLWSESDKHGELHKWSDPAPKELGGERAPSALAYLLGNAVPNHLERTRWLLEHGADARGINLYSREPVIKHALLAGREDVAALLVQYGATRPRLSEEEQFLAATVAGNLATMRRLALMYPEFLKSHHPMFAAIRLNRTDIAEALVDLGMSADVADDKNLRALHYTTHCGAVEIARLLIARGAEIDPFELRYGGTPLTHAAFHERTDMVELLARHSRNFRGLCYAGAVDRLHELLLEEPDRANREDRPGEPALFCLPGDEEKAVGVAELLLSFGADPTSRNRLGQTPAEAARRRGLDEAAALLAEAAKSPR